MALSFFIHQLKDYYCVMAFSVSQILRSHYARKFLKVIAYIYFSFGMAPIYQIINLIDKVFQLIDPEELILCNGLQCIQDT